MNVDSVVRADGTLELEGKVPLPPDNVSVTLDRVPYSERAAAFLEFIRGIQAIRESRGVKADAAAAIAAARKVRDEFDEQVEEIGRFQDACRHRRLEAEAAPKEPQ